jgi:putative membrane protein
MHTIVHLAALTAAVLAIARFVPDVRVKNAVTAIVVAVVFSVLNFFIGWLIRGILVVPALLTLGLLFFVIPFIANTVLLWLTDKLIRDFEIRSIRALLLSAAVITAVNWLFQITVHGHRMPRWHY